MPRTRLSLLLVASTTIFGAQACGADGPPGGGGLVGPGPGPGGDGGSTLPGIDAAVGAPGTVSGSVLGRSNRVPIGARQIKVRDGAGKVTDGVTDATGNFSIPNVAPPYDLYIAPSGPSLSSTHTIYLGLRAMNVRVFGDITETPSPNMGANIKLSWTNPNCSSGTCKYYVVGKTPDGSVKRAGQGDRPIGDPPGLRELTFPMQWFGPASTTCDLALLLAGTDGQSHYYGTVSVAVTNGQQATATFTPLTVPTLGAATLTAAPIAAAGFATPDARVYLQLAGNLGSFEIIPGGPSPATFALPSLAGATLSFASTSNGPSPPVYIVGGSKLGDPLTAGPHTIELGEAYPVTAPKENEVVSVGQGAIQFRQAAGAHYRIVTYVPPDKPGFVALTGDGALPLARVNDLTQVTPGQGELIVEEHARALDEYATNVFVEATDRFATSSYVVKLSR